MSASENIPVIWSRLNAGLKAFILPKVTNEADAEDILQEVFIKLHDNIGKIKDSEAIKPWIYRVAQNLVTDYYRRQKKEASLQVASSDLYGTSKKNQYMDTAVNDMISMMDDLPPEYCEALCLTEIEGLSQKEYAEKAGLSYSGAKSRVQRARVMLKDMLLKCCHYQFDKYGTVYHIQPKCCSC
jgi:RNA polymerase sigma-70 factor (ECF subfamily)